MAARAAAAKKKQKKQAPRSRRADRRRFRRVAVVYDVDGPRVRLGILWFFLVLVALVGGVIGLVVLFAPTAAVAAMQTSRCIRTASTAATSPRPDRAVAGGGAALLVIAGAVTTGMVGIAILVLVAAAVYVAWSDTTARGRARRSPIVDAAATIRAALFPGFAAACVIITARFELGSAVALLFVVAAYETGDYLIGSGAGNPYEGPVAGATAIVVVTFAITAAGVKPLAFPSSFVLGAIACVLCPIGQLLASLVLPSPTSPASALRRLDSLLVLAPAWAIATGWLI